MDRKVGTIIATTISLISVVLLIMFFATGGFGYKQKYEHGSSLCSGHYTTFKGDIL